MRMHWNIPPPRALSLYPVSRIGLLYFYPSRVRQDNVELLLYESEITWVEIGKDEQGFPNFIDEVLGVLESPTIPAYSPNCQWCSYLLRGALNTSHFDHNHAPKSGFMGSI